MTLRAGHRRHPVIGAVERDGRYANPGKGGELLLDCFQAGVAGDPSEAMALGMNHDLNKIRIVEGSRGPLKGRVIEAPVGRP